MSLNPPKTGLSTLLMILRSRFGMELLLDGAHTRGRTDHIVLWNVRAQVSLVHMEQRAGQLGTPSTHHGMSLDTSNTTRGTCNTRAPLWAPAITNRVCGSKRVIALSGSRAGACSRIAPRPCNSNSHHRRRGPAARPRAANTHRNGACARLASYIWLPWCVNSGNNALPMRTIYAAASQLIHVSWWYIHAPCFISRQGPLTKGSLHVPVSGSAGPASSLRLQPPSPLALALRLQAPAQSV